MSKSAVDFYATLGEAMRSAMMSKEQMYTHVRLHPITWRAVRQHAASYTLVTADNGRNLISNIIVIQDLSMQPYVLRFEREVPAVVRAIPGEDVTT